MKCNSIEFVIIDVEDDVVTILSDKEQIDILVDSVENAGWKKQKDTTGDIFMYGMNPFVYLQRENYKIRICCQLSCRSTQRNAWIPLDRIINKPGIIKNDGIGGFFISHEDLICYLLAKGVYTNGYFSDKDIARINKELSSADKTLLMSKLEMVFFKFSSRILEMAQSGNYKDIKEALWSFSDY